MLRSTHGIKLEQELNEIPQEFLAEQKRKINVALVSLNDASKGPEPLDHYVVIIKHDVDEAMRCAQQAAADAPADECSKLPLRQANRHTLQVRSFAQPCAQFRHAGTDETGTKLRWTVTTVDQSALVISNLEGGDEDTKARTTRWDAHGVSKQKVVGTTASSCVSRVRCFGKEGTFMIRVGS